jgi:hypothetical protein
MTRLAWIVLALVGLFAAAPRAHAQEEAAEAETEPAEDADAEDAAGEEDPVAKQEIGVRIGAQVGLSSLTPGGFRLGGVYLYRVHDVVWFDGEASTSFGSGGSGCFYTRAESLTLECHHGGFDGFAMSASAGVRVFYDRRTSGFHPYVRTGLGLSYAGFAADEVGGAVLFGYGGAGGRFRVAPRVAVGGEALLLLGPGLYNQDLGLQFVGGLVVQFGVEFAL